MALDLVTELVGLLDALERESVDYAVCGGLAVGMLARPRATKDIDILIQRDDLARAKALAIACGFDIPARKMIFKQGTPQEQEMHRLSKIDPEDGALMPVDFLLVVKLFETVWNSRLSVEYLGRKIKVVSIEGLVTMKTISGRPQDLRDIELLKNPDAESDNT
ncbi:MAG TPA: hypothetical protein VGM90_36315 [Kofleriaceae bacterium]